MYCQGARPAAGPLVAVPFLTPRLSSHWVGLVTPVANSIARPLIEGLDNEVTVDDPAKARRLFPDVEPMSYEAAVRLALRRTDAGEVPTVWNAALSSHPKPGHAATVTSASETAEGLERQTYQRLVRASAANAFATVERLGGETGWLFANRLWRVRGFFDALAGGIGYRQGRRSATALHVGDPVDFWRVDDVRHDGDRRLLRLRAEMQMPGRAWLQYEVVPEAPRRRRHAALPPGADHLLRAARPRGSRLLVARGPAAPLRLRRHGPRAGRAHRGRGAPHGRGGSPRARRGERLTRRMPPPSAGGADGPGGWRSIGQTDDGRASR